MCGRVILCLNGKLEETEKVCISFFFLLSVLPVIFYLRVTLSNLRFSFFFNFSFNFFIFDFSFSFY